MTESVTVEPLGARPLAASVRVPGSKSYTNRALLVAALAEGDSALSGALFSDDTYYMSQALSELGISVLADEANASFRVRGCGGQVPDVERELYVGTAGTAARFLAAALVLGRGSYRVDGSERMRTRPMADLLDALGALGASVVCHERPGCLPVTLSGKDRPEGDVTLAIPGTASSQFASGLLLAAPYFGGDVRLDVVGELVSKPYLDLTLQVMAAFGVRVDNDAYRSFRVARGQRYQGRDYAIEPDASAASYFFAAAAICGGRVTVEGLGSQTKQGDYRLVDILERMGARVEREPGRTTVTGTGRLSGVEVDMSDLTDVAQTLAMVATFADGPTRITGIGFIRHKETDRVGNVVAELQRLGIRAQEEPDGYVIEPGPAQAGTVRTYDDHRMAMSFALLGLKYPGIAISDPGCTAKTFPNYFDVLERLRA
jgi:3-phosphoshikimate 1-carboxyvinyltransferase